MTDKYTIIKENFDTTNGTTTVIISTHLGHFEGTTVIDDIDAEYPSVYQGYEIALAKALRKFAQAAARILKHEIKTLSNMISETFGHGPVDAKSHPVKVLLATTKMKKEELKLWQDRIANITTTIKNRIITRDKLVAKYNKDKNN
jgi:hypothetical protein